jgi:hypothetical protein
MENPNIIFHSQRGRLPPFGRLLVKALLGLKALPGNVAPNTIVMILDIILTTIMIVMAIIDQ